MRGILTYIDHNKGYGYLRYGANKSIYFHRNHVADLHGFKGLCEGLWISFNIIKRGKNPMAVDVKRVIKV